MHCRGGLFFVGLCGIVCFAFFVCMWPSSFLSVWRGSFLLDVCLIVFLFVVCYCLVMILFNRKFKQLQRDVEGLSSRVSGVNHDLRALEDNVCLSRDWDCLVGFVLGEARVSGRWDAFVIPLGDRFRWGRVDKELHCGVSVGRLREKVVGAGYDFSRLVLRGCGDVEDVLRALCYGDSLGVFVDEDVLKVRVKS